MPAPLMALQVKPVDINPVGSFMAGKQFATEQKAAAQTAELRDMQMDEAQFNAEHRDERYAAEQELSQIKLTAAKREEYLAGSQLVAAAAASAFPDGVDGEYDEEAWRTAVQDLTELGVPEGTLKLTEAFARSVFARSPQFMDDMTREATLLGMQIKNREFEDALAGDVADEADSGFLMQMAEAFPNDPTVQMIVSRAMARGETGEAGSFASGADQLLEHFASAGGDAATTDQKDYLYFLNHDVPAGVPWMPFEEFRLKKARAGVPGSEQANAFTAGLTEQALGQFQAQGESASEAANLLRINNDSLATLNRDGGIIAGAFGDWKLAFGKAMIAAGVIDPGSDEAETIYNTETYFAQRGEAVGLIIKQFGSGTGLSDADRIYALQIAGGSPIMEEASMRLILDISNRASRREIEAYNERVAMEEGDPDPVTGLYAHGSRTSLKIPLPPISPETIPHGDIEAGYTYFNETTGKLLEYLGGSQLNPGNWKVVE